MANKRISTTTLPANFQDGQVLYGADVNKIINILREGINYNRFYLDTLLGGTSEIIVRETEASLPTEGVTSGTKGYVYTRIGEAGITVGYSDLTIYTYNGTAWVAGDTLSLIDIYERLETAESNIVSTQTSLDGKEDAFAKNTAFNKNFGTEAGTVAEGNHTHTEADITDLDKYTQTQVNSLLSTKVDENLSEYTNVETITDNDTYYLYQNGGKKVTVQNLKNYLTSELTGIEFQVVSELPTTGQAGFIYLVPGTDPQAPDLYDEYVWTSNNAWEVIGTTDAKFTDYDTSAEVDAKVDIPLRLQLYPNTKNTSGVVIPKGAVVQYVDSSGTEILIKQAVASEINANPSLLMGLAYENIPHDSMGDVIWFGEITGLDLTGFADGELLWFDTSTGGLTNSEPSTDKIQIAAVVKGGNGGALLVRPKFVSRNISDVDGLQTALDGKVAKTGDTITGQLNVVSSSTTQVPLVVNTPSGQTALLQEWKANGSLRASIDADGGRIRTLGGLSNLTNFNSALINPTDNGTTISRNVADANPALVVNQANASSTGDILQLQKSGTTLARVTSGGAIFGTSFYDLNNGVYFLDPSSTSTSLNVAGNVGIGTTTPNLVNAGREVTISGVGISGQEYAFLNLQGSQTTDTNNVSGLTFNNLISGTNTNISAILARRSGANNSGRLIFQTNNAGTNSEKMTIMPNGNVGIGNTAPTEKLDVTGNIKASGSVTSDTATVTNNATVGTLTIGDFQMSFNSSTGSLNFEYIGD